MQGCLDGNIRPQGKISNVKISNKRQWNNMREWLQISIVQAYLERMEESSQPSKYHKFELGGT